MSDECGMMNEYSKINIIVHFLYVPFVTALKIAPEGRNNHSPRRKPWVRDKYSIEPRRGDRIPGIIRINLLVLSPLRGSNISPPHTHGLRRGL